MISKDHVGIFREQMRKKGSTKKCSYYFATTPGQSPLEKEKKWYDYINDAEDLLSKKISWASETLLPVSSITQQPAKKRKLKTSEEQAPEDKPLESAIIIAPISSSVHYRLAADTPYDYFDSPEARILFAANENEDTCQSIRAQIRLLESKYIVYRNDGRILTSHNSTRDGPEGNGGAKQQQSTFVR